MPTPIILIISYKYYLLFPLAFIEGPFVMMISGFLVKLGYLNFTLAYVILMTGDLIGDIAWYAVGYKFGMPFARRFGKFLNITEEKILKIKEIFLRYDSTILFVSKITMGLGFALVTLITAGLAKVPFRRFVFWNALGGLMWTLGLMIIGFSLGDFYLKVNGALGKLGILSLFVVVFIVLISIAKYVRSRFSGKKSL